MSDCRENKREGGRKVILSLVSNPRSLSDSPWGESYFALPARSLQDFLVSPINSFPCEVRNMPEGGRRQGILPVLSCPLLCARSCGIPRP